MDPFIESQKWRGFQHVLIAELARMLVAQFRPRYEVDPDKRIYFESAEPDPGVHALPNPIEEREAFLTIRKTGEKNVVCVIELLSPTNKRAGSDGRREYLAKRQEVLHSDAHLVEIDLLLGGSRLPLSPRLRTSADYCAIVSRKNRRPRVDVFEWTLRDRLPRIPIPLAGGDPDVMVDLQAAMTAVYDSAGYDYSLYYDQEPALPFKPNEAEWVREIAATRRPPGM